MSRSLSILVFALAAALLNNVIPLAPAFGEETGQRDKNAGEESLDDYEDALFDELTFLQEAGVVELAARHRQEIGMSPSAISVITREDIETSGATSIPDLLRLVPGMDVVLVTPFFSSVMSRLHWEYTNYHYLVLVDGREANLELLGQPPWEQLPIFLEDIERIEVIRGPASSLYGANAFAGVISITTRRIEEKTSAWLRVAGGESGALAAAARTSVRIGDWGFSASGGGDLAERFSQRGVLGKETWKLRLVTEYRWPDSRRFLADGGVSGVLGPVNSNRFTFHINSILGSLRLAYDSENLRGQLYWSGFRLSSDIVDDLEYLGVRLATTPPLTSHGHVVDGQIQWTPLQLWESLLVVVGAGGRISWLGSDDFLDAETYTKTSSARYHDAGISYWETRAGAFAHAELSPAEWVKVTGGLRLDYSTETGEFLSPRLAAVFRPAKGQFLRLGAGRAFRKPAFWETRLHITVEFPEDSPFQGRSQEHFLEFMSKAIGNSDLDCEELLALEVGYLGEFLEGRLSVALDLYYNFFMNQSVMILNIVSNETDLFDLDKSEFIFTNSGIRRDIFGGELTVRLNLSKNVSLVASWAHREVFNTKYDRILDSSPKNLITLGGRFRTVSGFLGSLYAFSRSEFIFGVESPGGVLSTPQWTHMDNVILLLGRLGWKTDLSSGGGLEAGVKLFLPISPFSAPHFRYYESGGMETPDGTHYGGDVLSRRVMFYLEGSL
jgi:iron complex outermembrane receptor protein